MNCPNCNRALTERSEVLSFIIDGEGYKDNMMHQWYECPNGHTFPEDDVNPYSMTQVTELPITNPISRRLRAL